jgi:hypothetical protein
VLFFLLVSFRSFSGVHHCCSPRTAFLPSGPWRPRELESVSCQQFTRAQCSSAGLLSVSFVSAVSGERVSVAAVPFLCQRTTEGSSSQHLLPSQASPCLRFCVCAWEQHLSSLVARSLASLCARQGTQSTTHFDSDFALKCSAPELVCVSCR